MGKSQRQKGVRGELEVINRLNEVLGTDIARNSQRQYMSGDGDIHLLGFCIEVKRVEQLSLKSWWEKNVEDSRKSDEVPVLIYRQSRQPWRVVMPFCYFNQSFNEMKSGYSTMPDWYEDYDRTVTMLFEPMFLDILKLVARERALEEMAQHTAH